MSCRIIYTVFATPPVSLLNLFDYIFDDYEEQKFNPISEWRDDWGLEKLGLVEKKDNQKYVKEEVKSYYLKFYSIFIGKIICYIGALCIIVFY